MINYCQWVHVEKREIRVNDGKDFFNAGNLAGCADITISDNAADGLITTATDAGDSTVLLTMLQVY